MDVQEDALKAGRLPSEEGWGEDDPARYGVLTVDGHDEAVRTEPGAYQRFYSELVLALRDGAPAPVDPAGSVATLAVLEAARRSADTRQVVTLD